MVELKIYRLNAENDNHLSIKKNTHINQRLAEVGLAPEDFGILVHVQQ